MNDTNTVFNPHTSLAAEIEECKALAINLVKQRLADGSATSQETTLFLRYACEDEREALEQANLRKDIELKDAKINNLESQERQEEAFQEVIRAIKGYGGFQSDDQDVF